MDTDTIKTSLPAGARAGDGNLPEPFWYAVVSERAPVINSTFRRADVAEEWAAKHRVNWPDVEVVPLYRAAAPAVSAPAEAAMNDWEMGDWQQYAKEGETAQACIERHRGEHDSLLRLLAKARGEQERAYRCIQGMHNALHKGTPFDEAYHSLTVGAAKRFIFEGALDGSDYFVGKKVEVLHAALALPAAIQAPGATQAATASPGTSAST